MSEIQGISVEVPEFYFTINPDVEGNPLFVGMKITTSGTSHDFFLCLPNANDVELVARTFNRELLKVSNDLKRRGKYIQPVTGVNSDALRTEKKRK